ncbi:MAG: serine hydrolase domain-containing protein [Pseudomonadota bacterium]
MLLLKRAIAPLSLIALLACSPAASDPAAPMEDAFASEALTLLQAAYPEDGPGAAVIVTKNNETLFIDGRGLADMAEGELVQPDTVFRYASITKQFAAATLMLLVDDGLVDLDAPIGTYLPDYPEPGRAIPVRHLLNHTSGIPSYTGIPGWMVEANTARAYTTNEMLAVFQDLPADFEAGEQFAYNNSAYLLLGAVIESVTGQDWAEVVKDRITTPLGIDTIESGLMEGELNRMATGYTADNAAAQRLHMSVPHAAGALVGDVQGLADWANAFHDGAVVSADTYALMTSPTVTTSGEEVPYGYGLGFDTVKGYRTIEHSGGIFGFTTDSLYLPTEDIFVAVLANSDAPATPPSVMTTKLAALALDIRFPSFVAQEVDLDNLEPVLGVYKSETVTRTLLVRDGTLYTIREGSGESEVFPAGDNQFFYGQTSLSWFEIITGADGQPQMVFHAPDSLEADTLVWTGPVPEVATVGSEILETYLGNYALSIPLTATVAAQDGSLDKGITIQLTGQPPFALEASSDTEFAVPSVGAVIRFKPNDEGLMTLEILQGGQVITGELTEG